jgi:hypothetical protein
MLFNVGLGVLSIMLSTSDAVIIIITGIYKMLKKIIYRPFKKHNMKNNNDGLDYGV